MGPFDIPHHNHHYLQQHSSHNPATPISQGATESFLHLLLSPHCPLPDVRQLCVYIRETEAGGRAGLQQRGCPCEHGGDPSAEPCHLHPEEQAGPPGSEKNDVQDENIKLKKKLYGLGVEVFRKPFVFLPDTVAVLRAVVGSLWQTLPDLC